MTDDRELDSPALPTEVDPQTSSVSSDSGRQQANVWGPERRYEIQKEHGRGGLGRVFRACDRRLGRVVALKELLPGAGTMSEARFVREAHIAARLDHPGIVPVYEAGRWSSGKPFYAMKLVSGEPLKQLIADAGALQRRLALIPYVIAVADAVGYAHSKRIIHRDLKPSNVIVGEFGETVVIDWGLAKKLDARDDGVWRESEQPEGDVTRAGDVVGTPAYMAPEQAAAGNVGTAADVYALGAILYHVLAGRAPYRGLAAGDILAAVKSDGPTRLADIDRHVPRELVAIVEQAMARDARARPDARGFADELRRFQRGQLVQAYRYSALELARHWIWRRRRWLGGGLAALVLATAAAVVWRLPADAAVSCAVSPEEFAGVWDDDVRIRLRAALNASGAPHATATFRRVERALDEYRARWSAAVVRSCEDTHLRGRQSLDMLDRRRRCLQERRQRLAAVTDLLSASREPELADKTLTLVSGMPPIEYCSDPEWLSAVVPPPEAALQGDVAALRAELVDVETRFLAGMRQDALDRAREVARRADELNYVPIRAWAQYWVETLTNEIGSLAPEVPVPWSLLADAARARDDVLAARSWAEIVQRLVFLDRFDEATALQRPASAAAERVAYDPVARGEVYLALGRMLVARNEFVEARAHLDRAIDAFSVLSPDHWGALDAVYQRATAYLHSGDYEAAERDYARYNAAMRGAHGEDHPLLVGGVDALGTSVFRQGRLEEGLALVEQALALGIARYGAGSPSISGSYGKVGTIYREMGQFERAREHYAKSLALIRTRSGQDAQRDIAMALDNLGRIETSLGRYARAEAYYDESRGVVADLDYPPILAARRSAGRAELYRRTRRHRGAVKEAREALAVLERTGNRNLEVGIFARRVLGDVELDRGRHAAAIRWFQEAKSLPTPQPSHRLLAEVDFGLARALWAQGRDRRRARELARRARDVFGQHGRGADRDVIARLEAWLAKYDRR